MHRPYLYLSSAEAQLSLGFAEQRPPESLFFALLPPPAIAAPARALADTLLAGQARRGRPLAEERLHVTLHFLGEFPGLPPRLLEEARAAAADVAMAPFELCLDQVRSFAGQRDRQPCVLGGTGEGVAGAHALYESLAAVLAKHRLRTLGPRFVPHMTLFYGPAVTAAAVPALRWQVDEFVLLRSFVGQGRYQEEGRWRLR